MTGNERASPAAADSLASVLRGRNRLGGALRGLLLAPPPAARAPPRLLLWLLLGGSVAVGARLGDASGDRSLDRLGSLLRPGFGRGGLGRPVGCGPSSCGRGRRASRGASSSSASRPAGRRRRRPRPARPARPRAREASASSTPSISASSSATTASTGALRGRAPAPGACRLRRQALDLRRPCPRPGSRSGRGGTTSSS